MILTADKQIWRNHPLKKKKKKKKAWKASRQHPDVGAFVRPAPVLGFLLSEKAGGSDGRQVELGLTTHLPHVKWCRIPPIRSRSEDAIQGPRLRYYL